MKLCELGSQFAAVAVKTKSPRRQGTVAVNRGFYWGKPRRGLAAVVQEFANVSVQNLLPAFRSRYTVGALGHRENTHRR